MNPSWIHQSTQGEKCDFHLASKSMTCVIDFGGTSMCRTESLIQLEIPKRKSSPLLSVCPKQARNPRANHRNVPLISSHYDIDLW